MLASTAGRWYGAAALTAPYTSDGLLSRATLHHGMLQHYECSINPSPVRLIVL